jgi:hypothetical protein
MRTPQQAADAWATNMAASQQKVTDGINAVTESPTAKAAQNLDKYVTGTQAAVASGKMARKLNAVSLSDWNTAALAKVSRIGSGAQTAKPKMLRHLSAFLPFVAQVRQNVRQMPNATPSDRIARMVANAQQLAQFVPQ